MASGPVGDGLDCRPGSTPGPVFSNRPIQHHVVIDLKREAKWNGIEDRRGFIATVLLHRYRPTEQRARDICNRLETADPDEVHIIRLCLATSPSLAGVLDGLWRRTRDPRATALPDFGPPQPWPTSPRTPRPWPRRLPASQKLWEERTTATSDDQPLVPLENWSCPNSPNSSEMPALPQDTCGVRRGPRRIGR